MSEIFLSYKSEDREKAQIIAEALERNGYTVWWDRIIPPGKTFAQVIEEEIDAANCVIVLWSKKSVKSDWVKNEAHEGTRRRILIPVLIDNVKIPFEFRHIHAANLIDWQGTLPNPEFDLLLKSVEDISGKPPVTKIEVKKPPIEELNISAQQRYEKGKYPGATDKWKENLKNINFPSVIATTWKWLILIIVGSWIFAMVTLSLESLPDFEGFTIIALICLAIFVLIMAMYHKRHGSQTRFQLENLALWSGFTSGWSVIYGEVLDDLLITTILCCLGSAVIGGIYIHFRRQKNT